MSAMNVTQNIPHSLVLETIGPCVNYSRSNSRVRAPTRHDVTESITPLGHRDLQDSRPAFSILNETIKVICPSGINLTGRSKHQLGIKLLHS